MSDQGDGARSRWDDSAAQVIETAAYHAGYFAVCAIVALGIVGTWGTPDLIDGMIAMMSGATLDCVTGAFE